MPDIYAVRVRHNDQVQIYEIRDRISRNGRFTGDVYVNANPDYTGGTKLPDETRVGAMISAAIGEANIITTTIVQSRPQTGEPNTIYFVPKQNSSGDVYDEFMYINNAWELIGTTQIDVSDKADKTDTVLNTTLSIGRAANETVGTNSVALGNNVVASGNLSQAFGASTLAGGYASHSEGSSTTANGFAAHAEGSGTIASGNNTHSEGAGSTASAAAAHAEGTTTVASGQNAHSEGISSTASGYAAHAEGSQTQAIGDISHAEGQETRVSGLAGHAEGYSTEASGQNSHSEGSSTVASGFSAHAEGVNTIAAGSESHTSGRYNVADTFDNIPDWVAETPYNVGDAVKIATISNGVTIYRKYICKIANNDSVFTSSKWYNFNQEMEYAEIIGNGFSNNARSNARTLDWNGNEHLAGDIYVHANSDGSGGDKLPDESRVAVLIATAIAQAIGGISSFDISIVQSLPQTGNAHTIYFVPKVGSVGDAYNEYMHINDSWELVGTTEIDLSGKADKTDTVLNTTLSRGRKANTSIGDASFAFGDNVTASGNISHAEGTGTRASGSSSHAEGSYSVASADNAHAEGSGTTAGNNGAHAEGEHTEVTGSGGAHAEGYYTSSSGSSGHAEGVETQANGYASHAQGENTIANASASHVFGRYNIADAYGNDWEEWVSGKLYKVGDKVKQTFDWGANYYICAIENEDLEFTWSHWTYDSNSMNFVEIVGNGTEDARSNARTLDWQGNERLVGDLYVGCNPDSTGGSKVLTENDLEYTTEADALKIISDFWEEEEDDSMIVEMVSTSDGYASVMDVSEIVSAIESGKIIMLHFPAEDSHPDAYAMLGYYAPALENSNYTEPIFAFAEIGSTGNYGFDIVSQLNYFFVDSNGKLAIYYAA